jgi:hypothetical protein
MEYTLEDLTVEEIAAGYRKDAEGNCTCLACATLFPHGEIFNFNERFFEPERAVQLHLQTEHPQYFFNLLNSDSRYVSFTENQKQLLTLLQSGLSDKEIAQKTGLAQPTIRHQRFTFREKAKQAKMTLALYEMAMAARRGGDEEIVSIHDNAKMVDARYVTTTVEKEKTIASFFEAESPLRLKSLPAREKKKIIVLSRIAEEFTPRHKYSEADVNRMLKDIYEDHATLRRYLIEYGFFGRTIDGSAYWRNEGPGHTAP